MEKEDNICRAIVLLRKGKMGKEKEGYIREGKMYFLWRRRNTGKEKEENIWNIFAEAKKKREGKGRSFERGGPSR